MEKQKKVILTISKVFPATHKRAGELTGFEEKLKSGEKIHTIRENNSGVWDVKCKEIGSGKKCLSIREWTGKPYRSEQRVLGERDVIGVQDIVMTKTDDEIVPRIWVNCKAVEVEVIAAKEGLNVPDFIEWFFPKGTYMFRGAVIHLTDFRY